MRIFSAGRLSGVVMWCLPRSINEPPTTYLSLRSAPSSGQRNPTLSPQCGCTLLPSSLSPSSMLSRKWLPIDRLSWVLGKCQNPLHVFLVSADIRCAAAFQVPASYSTLMLYLGSFSLKYLVYVREETTHSMTNTQVRTSSVNLLGVIHGSHAFPVCSVFEQAGSDIVSHIGIFPSRPHIILADAAAIKVYFTSLYPIFEIFSNDVDLTGSYYQPREVPQTNRAVPHFVFLWPQYCCFRRRGMEEAPEDFGADLFRRTCSRSSLASCFNVTLF